MIGKIIAAIKLYREWRHVIDPVRSWLAKPWVKKTLGFLAALFKREPDPDAPKVLPRDHPDRPRDGVEDLKSENLPNV